MTVVAVKNVIRLIWFVG